MATIYRLAEEIKKLLDGGDSPVAAATTIPEIKIAIGQVANSLLKTDYFQVNGGMGEAIPNGSMIALYEDIAVVSSNAKSKAALPIKPVKLPRNMGVWAIYPKYTTDGDYELDKEFIPLQMGQGALLKSQPLISDLLGQVGYEVFGNDVILTKDIKSMFPEVTLAMQLVIMDISQYDDYTNLPLTPEIEWQIKQEVVKLYSGEPVPDKVVDSTSKEQKGIPVNQQKQS